jgi:hypothetical protein
MAFSGRLNTSANSFAEHQATPASSTAWGPFCERKTSKMRPYGGRLRRDFKLKTKDV